MKSPWSEVKTTTVLRSNPDSRRCASKRPTASSMKAMAPWLSAMATRASMGVTAIARLVPAGRCPESRSACSARLSGTSAGVAGPTCRGKATSAGSNRSHQRPGGLNGWWGSGKEQWTKKGCAPWLPRWCARSHSIVRSAT